MTIDSLFSGSLTGRRTGDMFVQMRARMDDLQRQLATGKKSDSFADLGVDRRISLSTRAKLGTLEGWTKAIDQGDMRIKFMMQSIEGFAKQTAEGKGDARPGAYVVGADGQVAGQVLAANRLSQSIDMLNAEVGGRYLFAGRSHDVKPVEAYTTIMKDIGSPGPAGVRTLISERQQADAGTDNLGRLTNTVVGTTVTLAETAGSEFYGYRITDLASSTPNVTTALTPRVTTPAFAPGNAAFTVAANPIAGDKFSVTLELPDGSTETLELQARLPNVGGPADTGFTIGATPAATAANLQTSIGAALQKRTQTAMAAASAMIGARDFFAGSESNPPLRVPGPGFATATTAPAAGLPGATVIWYKGDDAAGPARNSATVQVDDGQVVATGARANEQTFREGLAAFAVYATMTFAPTDPNARDRYEEMADRVRDKLSFNGVQKPQDVAMEISAAQVSMASAKERHTMTGNFLETARAGVEDASDEAVATALLALQTQMQASYQTTAILSRLTLTSYL